MAVKKQPKGLIGKSEKKVMQDQREYDNLDFLYKNMEG